MFENLTSQQKIMFVLLGIVALICLVLVLYFALSKKSCPNPPNPNKCTPPSLVKFRNTVSGTDIPWMTQTWYKYSYVDSKGNEGEQSDVSTGQPIKSPTKTNPIIQVTINSPYSIKIYRSVDNNNFTELKEVSVDKNGLFTDTNNPYTPPVIPKPADAPTLLSFSSSTGTPWKTQTWYKYSYVDNDSNEGEQSDVSPDKPPIQSPTQTNPIIQVTPKLNYKIKIYRSVDNSTFTELKRVDVNPTTGLFTDTNNPYTPPVIPKPANAPTLSSWGGGGGGGGGLMCPESSKKCSEPCTSSGQCDPKLNPWQCTLGQGVAGACSPKNDWESDSNCNAYCYIKS